MELTRIESVLRNAPRPQPPRGLLDNLQRPPDAQRRRVTVPIMAGLLQWLPRWAPAAATVAVLLAGAALWAVQSDALSKLRARQAQLPIQNAQPALTTRAAESELASLRKDLAEVQRLRADLERLRADAAALPALRMENERLRAELAQLGGRQPAGGTLEEQQSLRCIDNLKAIGLAARIYASEHQDAYPKDFLEMAAALGSPKVLHCPSDSERPLVQEWESFAPTAASYQSFLAPDLGAQPDAIIAKCLIHDHVALADGSVYRDLAKSNIRIVHQDGRAVLVLPKPGANPPSYFE
jgi:hypothetical protein